MEGLHFWLVGEVEEIPPYAALRDMQSLLEGLGLKTSDTMQLFRPTDRGTTSRSTKSWTAGLKGLRIGDGLIDGGYSYRAGFLFDGRRLVCRVPGDMVDGATIAWTLALELYRLWRPREFFGILHYLHIEPHIAQCPDLATREAFVPGLYGYSWIVAAGFDRYAPLAESLHSAAVDRSGISVAMVPELGLLARLREKPSLITVSDLQSWGTLLAPWVKPSDCSPTSPSLMPWPAETTPWVLWGK